MDEEWAGILLFDGVCSLCNGLVDFLIRRDRRGRLRFGALQSDPARELLEGRRLAHADEMDTVVLVTDDVVSTRSDAVIGALVLLGGAWRAVGILRVVPRPIRDGVYRFVARHRYRVFGRRDTCRIPTAEEARRFIE